MAYSFAGNNWDNTSKRSRSMFHRLSTGLRIASYQGQTCRFLTLTTAKQRVYYRAKNGEVKVRGIKASWAALRKKIQDATIEKDGFQGFKLNKYICFRTSEGNGVLHIVFWGGRFIPQAWLSYQWERIHGAFKADIRIVKKRTVNGLVGYLLDRYLLNQPIERMSYGWGWAWLGFCKSWKNFKATYSMMRKGQLTYNKQGQVEWDQEHIDNSGLVPKTVNYVPFAKRYSNKCVSGWKAKLGDIRKTSRQKKFTVTEEGLLKLGSIYL